MKNYKLNEKMCWFADVGEDKCFENLQDLHTITHPVKFYYNKLFRLKTYIISFFKLLCC